MKKHNNDVVVLDLASTYHELGEYNFKIALNPKVFKNGHSVSISMFDADQHDMEVDMRHWGRKISCIFNVTKDTPDGVCVVKMKARTDSGKSVNKVFHYWVIK